MASKVEKIMENPSLEEILALKRTELIDLAGHSGVSIKKYFKKQQILDEIIVNLVDNEILKEEAMEYVSKEEVSEAIKINGIRNVERNKRKRNPNTSKRNVNRREINNY